MLSKTISKGKTFVHNINWKPNIPKYKIVIDKNSYHSPHPIWNMKYAENIDATERTPETKRDKVASYLFKFFQYSFDKFTGYNAGKMNEQKYLRRCLLNETFSAVPGMIGGMSRHLASLRSLREDGGWIHHLLEEAENSRMHLFTWLRIRQPGVMERLFILFSQLCFIGYYSVLYSISSKTAHRLVAYMNEFSIRIYSELLRDLDNGKLSYWKDKPASKEDSKYWDLEDDAALREVIVAIRADKVFHREFNHHFADIHKTTPIEGHNLVVLTEEQDLKWEEEEEKDIDRSNKRI